MAQPRALVFAGQGINCEDETAFALKKAGATTAFGHLNDIIEGHTRLDDYHILAFPGGFSYGDDTGSGKAFANMIRNHLLEQVMEFISKDKLVIGICNGFQILVNLGLVPGLDGNYGTASVALVDNKFPRYNCRWVDLKFESSGPWTNGLVTISMPIAHGEGNFYASPDILQKIERNKLVAARYVLGEMCAYHCMEPNPNGSLNDIAGITDETGRILGLMPHPERAVDTTQQPNWPVKCRQSIRDGRGMPDREGDGMKIFRNGVNYFR